MMRVTRLTVDGSIDPSYPVLTTKGFMTATFTPEFEDGDEIAEKNASGEVCIAFKADDTFKRITFALSVCSPDPEVAALLAGGKVILACDAVDDTDVVQGDVVGYSSPLVGDVVGNPVAIEIWSIANVGGKPATGLPYWHYAFPYVKVRYEGDREFTNGALANQFTGQGLGNDALVDDGLGDPGDDFVIYKDALERPFSYVRSATIPDEGWSGSLVVTGDNAINCDTLVWTDVNPGTPGEFVPADAFADDLAAANAGADPTPATAWSTGQYVVLGDGTHAYWNGTAFLEGEAP